MSGWRLLVCGGRHYADADRVAEVLDRFQIAELCHGAAPGADTLAGVYAAEHGIDCVDYPADWDRYGKAAGPIRNAEMLLDFGPDAVIAFPGGRGTAHMVGIARKAGVPVKLVDQPSDQPVSKEQR